MSHTRHQINYDTLRELEIMRQNMGIPARVIGPERWDCLKNAVDHDAYVIAVAYIMEKFASHVFSE